MSTWITKAMIRVHPPFCYYGNPDVQLCLSTKLTYLESFRVAYFRGRLWLYLLDGFIFAVSVSDRFKLCYVARPYRFLTFLHCRSLGNNCFRNSCSVFYYLFYLTFIDKQTLLKVMELVYPIHKSEPSTPKST